MRKGGRGVIFEVPLIATEKEGTVKIEPDPHSSTKQFWNQQKNTFTFDKSKFQGMRKKDYHLVQFTLAEDNTTAGIRFPKNEKDAMWVVNREDCPGPEDTCEYDMMRPIAVIEGDTLLAVNFNKTKGQKFGFTLNFVRTDTPDDTDHNNYISWDPIGDDQNGGLN